MESINYESRASKLKTRGQQRKAHAKEAEDALIKGQYTKEAFWKKFVKSQADVERFYQVYYPQYPEQLISAIGMRIAKLMDKIKEGQPLTDDEKSFFKVPENSVWDPEEDLKREEMAGKIQAAMKKMEELKHE